MSENRVKSIYLSLGSNLGNRKKNIEIAKSKIVQNKIKILQISNYYETLSWPDPKKPKFLNIVLKILSKNTPNELLSIFSEIEAFLGRKKTIKNAPRVCDIDIIDYAGKQTNGQIILPHPRMHKRNFVLFPLFELDKDWKHPVLKQNIKKLISLLPDKDITSIKLI